MVGVDSGSLYRRTHSLSRLAWFWVGGRLAPFYIHQINRVNSHNDSTMNIVLELLLLLLFINLGGVMPNNWDSGTGRTHDIITSREMVVTPRCDVITRSREMTVTPRCDVTW